MALAHTSTSRLATRLLNTSYYNSQACWTDKSKPTQWDVLLCMSDPTQMLQMSNNNSSSNINNKDAKMLVVVWCSGSAMASINEVNLRQAWLVLGWVTMSGFNSWCRTFISICNRPPRSIQLGHPFVWVGAMSTSQRAMTPCGWGAKAGVVRVWVACKTVWSPCYLSLIHIWRCRRRG